eukprot:RCo031081
MGKMKKHSGKQSKAKIQRQRKISPSGRVKRHKGDPRTFYKDFSIKYEVKGFKKGGKAIPGKRVCRLHTKCDCLEKTDTDGRTFVTNMPVMQSKKRQRLLHWEEEA